MEQKEILLRNWFIDYPKVLVALSGGVDSCLLARVAREELGPEGVVAVVGVSASLKQKDLEESRQFCAEYDIKLVEVNPNEINDPNYSSNPINRCFFCKSALYEVMGTLREQDYPEYTVLNGNNKSDLGDYRPGLEAAKDYKALSPLALCEFEKEDIRSLANKLGLSVWDKPASPCLSSRFPYGEQITVDKLRRVEKAESILNEFGFENVRVRYKLNVARIEVPVDSIQKLNKHILEIEPRLIDAGFQAYEIDDEGFVSGKLNRGIDTNTK